MSNDKLRIFLYFSSVIVCGSAMLWLPAAWNGSEKLSYIDALFTATSAVCVTGLTTVNTAEYTVFGQTVIMLLIQFGGLGIVTFATLYVAMPRKKVSLVNRGIIKEMYIDEVEYNPRRIVINIILATLLFECMGCVVLAWRFSAHGVEHYMFAAVFHSISAFCNAGFSVFGTNLEHFAFDIGINLTMILLIIMGGLGFVVMQDIVKVFTRKKRHFAYHTRIVLAMTSALITIGALAFYIFENSGAYRGFTVPQKILAAFFQSVTPRTAGFDTVPQSLLGAPSVFVIVLLMFTGGSPGSTAGGVKTTTMFMALAAAFHGYEDDGAVIYKGGALSARSVAKALSILSKAVCILGGVFILLLALESHKASFADILFETVSAFSTTGLSRGLTPHLHPVSKGIIIGTMYMGRVGLFTMAITRSAGRIERYAEYPRENLLLG